MKSQNGLSELPDYIRERLAVLRKESDDVKSCFTRFSFQALAFSSGALGLIFGTITAHPYVGLAGLPMAYLLAMVIRIGNYKYGTANRNFGYELHLHRALLYQNIDSPKSTRQIIDVGWEEAMFAWRIVQPALYKSIYKKALFAPCPQDNIRDGYRWWNTDALLKQYPHEPGGYLKTVQRFLGSLALIFFVPAYFTAWYYVNREPIGASARMWDWHLFGWATYYICNLALLHVVYKFCRETRDRKILESGINSVQASAVVWRCTAIVHFRALASRHHFRRYTEALGKEADELAKSVTDIHELLEAPDVFPHKPFQPLCSLPKSHQVEHLTK